MGANGAPFPLHNPAAGRHRGHDVAAVEDWARDQAALMAEIDAAASVRADLQESCLPPRARGIAGGGGLASTVTLHVLIARAPRTQAARLRQQRDTIRQLRDEIAAAILHNEVLIGQVLEFTDHLGHGLVDATRSEGYDKSGQQADHLASGELFSGAI